MTRIADAIPLAGVPQVCFVLPFKANCAALRKIVCTTRHSNETPQANNRNGPEFLQRWAACKDSSRRSETTTLRIARGKSGQCLFVTTKDTKHTKESHRGQAEALRLFMYFVVHSTSSQMLRMSDKKPMTTTAIVWNGRNHIP